MRLEQLLLLCFRWGNWGLTGIKYSPAASLVAQWVKNLPAMQEMLKMWVWSLGWEDALAEEMATHFSILAWKIPYTEEPDGLQPKGLQRVRYGWMIKHKHIVCNASKNHVGAAGKARLIPEISCASRRGPPTLPHLLWDSQESTTTMPRTPACSPPSWLAHILFFSCILIWHLLIITLPTKVHLVKAMVSPVVMYGCESWTVKKAECRKIDAFELWC